MVNLFTVYINWCLLGQFYSGCWLGYGQLNNNNNNGYF